MEQVKFDYINDFLHFLVRENFLKVCLSVMWISSLECIAMYIEQRSWKVKPIVSIYHYLSNFGFEKNYENYSRIQAQIS